MILHIPRGSVSRHISIFHTLTSFGMNDIHVSNMKDMVLPIISQMISQQQPLILFTVINSINSNSTVIIE